MSRIDEALKRASQGPLVGRIPAKRTDAPVRLGDEFALGDYPLESRNANARSDSPAVQPETSPTPRVQAGGVPSRLSADISQRPKLVVGPDTDASFLEQYRRLAAVLHDAQLEKGLKTVMVTSAVPREGKTLTVINLALTLSESYARRVLLIDADLRKPSIHEVLGTPNDRGLSDVLRSDRLEPNIIAVSPRLSFIPAGSVRDNPLAGLASARMRAFVDDFATRFDWVLLDAPPVGLLPDAQVLGRVAQASVFVIRAGVTPYPIVDRAITELGRDCIIGTVLNGVDENSLLTPYYYGHYQTEK
jgi:capsular exopolysaccharide synthesis family protein